MAEIWHDAATGAWLAEMRSTAYAFGLADGGAAVRHLHWGAPLPRAAVPGLLATATGEMPRHELRLSMTPHERPDEGVAYDLGQSREEWVPNHRKRPRLQDGIPSHVLFAAVRHEA